MVYVSQMGEMRRRAADDGIEFRQGHDDYRCALRQLQTCEGTTATFESQKYVAEHQAWDLNWPEAPFPGIDPRDPKTLTVLTSTSSPQPPPITQQEQQRRQTSKKLRGPQSSSSQSFNASSWPRSSLGQRNPNKKAKVSHRQPQKSSSLSSTRSKILICDNSDDEGLNIRLCTRNIEQSDFTNGCPRCNTREHNFADCQFKNKEDYLSPVRNRIRRPPLNKDYQKIDPEQWNIETLRQQTAQSAAAMLSQEISQGVDETVSDPSWFIPHIIGSQIHPLDLANTPRVFEAEPMELKYGASSQFAQTSQPQSLPPQQHVSTGYGPADPIPITSSDVHGVQSLLAILRQSEVQKISNQPVEPKVGDTLPRYNDPQFRILSNQNSTYKATVAPMGLNLSVGRISSGHDGLDNGVAAVVSFEKSANSISSKNGLSGRRSSYAVSSPSSFLVPNAANMASVTYSQRQREEFELPSSPFRSRLPTSTVQKLSRPMNIEQILYAKTAVVAPPQPGCDNCKHPGHMLKDCKEPCGLCDRARHTARECTFRLR